VQDQSIKRSGRLLNAVPSLLTLANALSGFAAVIAAAESISAGGHVPALALWFVFIAMLFDVLDGLTARLLNAGSVQGMNLDSLADVISFGVAPAYLIYVTGTNAGLQDLSFTAVVGLSGLFLGCALWRLAAYNSRAMLGLKDENMLLFAGLPSPAAAAMICSMVWLITQTHSHSPALLAACAVYPLAASLLMISRIPYPHLRNVTQRLPFALSVTAGLAALAMVVFQGIKGLVILSHAYVLSPLLYLLVSKRSPETGP
jgi:CDP-diacylglycerol--serine O-phosphatidyltransferase